MNNQIIYHFLGGCFFTFVVYLIVDSEKIFKPLLLDCLNGGVADGDSCECLPAFKGSQCEQNACLNGGYPVLGGSSGDEVLLHKKLEPRYRCECVGAFWGGNCSICKKIGYLPGTYVCDLNAPCENDWYGRKCDIFCDRKTTCSGHGVCQENGDCYCDQGYWSPAPDTQCLSSCAKGPNNEICSDHGECKNGECQCYAFGNRSASIAYVGVTCESQCPIANVKKKCKCLPWAYVNEVLFQEELTELVHDVEHYLREKTEGCLPGKSRAGSYCFANVSDKTCTYEVSDQPIQDIVKKKCNSHYTVGQEYVFVGGEMCGGGHCQTIDREAVCRCPRNKRGQACEFECPTTGTGRICNYPDGTCNERGVCECNNGYTGIACECSENVCGEHGVCNPEFDAKTNDFLCQCDDNVDKGFWAGDSKCSSCSPDFYSKDCDTFCEKYTTCGGNGLCIGGADGCAANSTFENPSCSELCASETHISNNEFIVRSKTDVLKNIPQNLQLRPEKTMIPGTAVLTITDVNYGGSNPYTTNQDCKVSAWSLWGECSVNGAFQGEQLRYRKITKSKIGFGSKKCPALLQKRNCSGTDYTDCVYGKWGEWGVCDNVFFGNKHRFRNITQSPSNGGVRCEIEAMVQTASCGDKKNTCIVSNWSSWSECDVDCINDINSYTGNQWRYRTVNYSVINTNCDKELIETKPCPLVFCDQKYPCTVGNWSKWSVCNVFCGSGEKYRYRDIKTKGVNSVCPDQIETAICVGEGCSEFKPCENVTFTKWGGWLPTCLDQKQYRFRQNVFKNEIPCYIPPYDFYEKRVCTNLSTTNGTCANKVLTDKSSSCTFSCGGYKFEQYDLSMQKGIGCPVFYLDYESCRQDLCPEINSDVFESVGVFLNVSASRSTCPLLNISNDVTQCTQQCRGGDVKATKITSQYDTSTGSPPKIPYLNAKNNKCPEPFTTVDCSDTLEPCKRDCGFVSVEPVTRCKNAKYIIKNIVIKTRMGGKTCAEENIKMYNSDDCVKWTTRTTKIKSVSNLGKKTLEQCKSECLSDCGGVMLNDESVCWIETSFNNEETMVEKNYTTYLKSDTFVKASCAYANVSTDQCIRADSCFKKGYKYVYLIIKEAGTECLLKDRMYKEDCENNATNPEPCRQKCESKNVHLGQGDTCGSEFYKTLDVQKGNGILNPPCSEIGTLLKLNNTSPCVQKKHKLSQKGLTQTVWNMKSTDGFFGWTDPPITVTLNSSISVSWREVRACTICKPYYYGVLCDVYCGPNTCSNGGVCGSDGRCVCKTGFDPSTNCVECLKGWYPPHECRRFCDNDAFNLEQCLLKTNEPASYSFQHRCMNWTEIHPELQSTEYSNIPKTAKGCQLDGVTKTFFCIGNSSTYGVRINNTNLYKMTCTGLYEENYAIVQTDPTYVLQNPTFECVYCSGHGTCAQHGGCICTANNEPTGYSGKHCDNACDKNNHYIKSCNGHGTCKQDVNTGDARCLCEKNYFGPQCQYDCSRLGQTFNNKLCNNMGTCGTTTRYTFKGERFEDVSCDSNNFVDRCSVGFENMTMDDKLQHMDIHEIYCNNNLLCAQTKCLCKEKYGFIGTACQYRCNVYTGESGKTSPCGIDESPPRGRCCINKPDDMNALDPDTQKCETGEDGHVVTTSGTNSYIPGYCHCRQPFNDKPPWFIGQSCGEKCPCLNISTGTCVDDSEVCVCKKNQVLKTQVDENVVTKKKTSAPVFCGLGCDRECPGTTKKGFCPFWDSAECFSTRVVCSGKGICQKASCTCECLDVMVDGVSYGSPYRGQDCSKTCPGYDPQKPSSVKNICGGRQRGTCTHVGNCNCNGGFKGADCQLFCPPFENNEDIQTTTKTCSGHGECVAIENRAAACSCYNKAEDGFWTTPGEFLNVFLKTPLFTKYINGYMKTNKENPVVKPNYQKLQKIIPNYHNIEKNYNLQEQKSCSFCQLGYFPKAETNRDSPEKKCMSTCGGSTPLYNTDFDEFSDEAYKNYNVPCNGIGYCAEDNTGGGQCICPTINMNKDCTECNADFFDPKHFCEDCYFWAWNDMNLRWPRQVPNCRVEKTTITSFSTKKKHEITSESVCNGRGVIVGSQRFSIANGQYDKNNRVPYIIITTNESETCFESCQNRYKDVQKNWVSVECAGTFVGGHVQDCFYDGFDSSDTHDCYCQQADVTQFQKNSEVVIVQNNYGDCLNSCISHIKSFWFFNHPSSQPSAPLYSLKNGNYVAQTDTDADECWCVKKDLNKKNTRPRKINVPAAGHCHCNVGYGGVDCALSFEEDVQKNVGVLAPCGNGASTFYNSSHHSDTTKTDYSCQCQYPYKITSREYNETSILGGARIIDYSGICGFCHPGYYNTYTSKTSSMPTARESSLDNIYSTFQCKKCPAGMFSPDPFDYDPLPNKTKMYLLPSMRTFDIETGVMHHAEEIATWYNSIINQSDYFSAGRQDELTCIPCFGAGSKRPFQDPDTAAEEIGNPPIFSKVTGTHAVNIGQSQCVPCAEHKFSNYDPWTGYPQLTFCNQCPSGKGYDPEKKSCETCAQGKYVASSSECEDCPAGRYTPSASFSYCPFCDQGKYSKPGQSECTTCPPGQHQQTHGASTCEECESGKYSEKGSKACKNCFGNKYSVKGDGICVSCPPGKHSATNKTGCGDCSPGTHPASTGDCEQCQNGRYFDYSLRLLYSPSNCPVCGDGKHSTGGNQCEPCGTGKYSTVVSFITAGFSYPWPDYEKVKKKCTDNKYKRPCTYNEYKHISQNYNKYGFVISGGAVVPYGNNQKGESGLANIGVYCCGNSIVSPNHQPQILCTPFCSAGVVSQTVTKVFPNELESCINCLEGKHTVSNFIAIQPNTGSYVYSSRHDAGAACSKLGYGLCSKDDVMSRFPLGECGAGFTSDGVGYPNDGCSSGSEPIGTWVDWSSWTGKRAAWCCDSGVVAMPETRDYIYANREDAGAACAGLGETYELCPRQRVLDRFPEGYCFYAYTSDNDDKQVGFPSSDIEGCGGPIPKGQWEGWAGGGLAGAWCCKAQVSSSCFDCPAGQYAPDTLAESCKQCEKGKYSESGKSECTPCESGKYSDTGGSATCKKCPAGKHQSSAGASTCEQCDFGRHQVSKGETSCNPCPPGSYQPDKGENSCIPCIKGSFSDGTYKGGITCQWCPAGKYQQSTGATLCHSCSPNTFCLGRDSDSEKCPAGKQSSAGASTCDECPSGKWTFTPGNECTNVCGDGFTLMQPFWDGYFEITKQIFIELAKVSVDGYAFQYGGFTPGYEGLEYEADLYFVGKTSNPIGGAAYGRPIIAKMMYKQGNYWYTTTVASGAAVSDKDIRCVTASIYLSLEQNYYANPENAFVCYSNAPESECFLCGCSVKYCGSDHAGPETPWISRTCKNKYTGGFDNLPCCP